MENGSNDSYKKENNIGDWSRERKVAEGGGRQKMKIIGGCVC